MASDIYSIMTRAIRSSGDRVPGAALQHRSAGPVDLVVAATAELHGLTLLHHDRKRRERT